jgi:1,4-dihydroxy-6-naphthoate synthase
LQTPLNIAFSPCPNDTFIFYGMIHKKIDTSIDYLPTLADVELLNKQTLSGSNIISKISFGILPHIRNQYTLLDCGGALGFKNGPMLIAAKPIDLNQQQLRVGIPGKSTTANKLLRYFYPHLTNKKEILFSDIETAILNGDIDLGLIIHESRFTFQSRGLIEIADLGEQWFREFNLPLPLGAIVLRNDFIEYREQVEQDIRNSIQFAYDHTDLVMLYIKQHAQDMADDVILKHIDLYVNKYSVAIGKDGMEAIKQLSEL